MYHNLLNSFMRQVMITRANNIPKKMKKILNKYHAFVEPLNKNMDKNYSRQKRAGWTEKK